MRVEHPTIKVFTMTEAVARLLDGLREGNHVLKVARDADGKPFISRNVAKHKGKILDAIIKKYGAQIREQYPNATKDDVINWLKARMELVPYVYNDEPE